MKPNNMPPSKKCIFNCRFLTFLERALNFNNEGKGFFVGDKVYIATDHFI